MTDTTQAPEGDEDLNTVDIKTTDQDFPEPQEEPAPAEEPAAQPEPKPEPDPLETSPKWARDTIKAKDKALKEVQRELEQLRAAQAAPAAAELPDPQYDPEGYRQAVVQQAEFLALNTRLDTSEMLARSKHGDEAVDDLTTWIQAQPALMQWAMQQRHPYEAAMQHFKREQLASEIGDDPEAWRAAERERIRAEMLAEMPANNGMAPQTRPVIPGPASQQRSAAPRTGSTGPTPLAGMLKNQF